jgi:hypothetical protein
MSSIRYCCQILIKQIFFDQFSKNTQILNFIKIRPVEAGVFHVEGRTDLWTDRQIDRQTDMMESISSFLQCCEYA